MSDSVRSISYVVPVHNGADQIRLTVPKLVERLRNFEKAEVILVENGSTDESAQIADEFSKQNGPVSIISAHSSTGLGNALRTGINLCSNDLVVLTACDLPFEFSDLDAALTLHPLPPLVLGSKAHPQSTVKTELLRRVMSVVFRILRRIILDVNVRDSQGSILIDKEIAQAVSGEVKDQGFFFSTELIARAAAKGIRPVEVPVNYINDTNSSTVSPIKDSLRVLFSMISLRRILANNVSRELAGPTSILKITFDRRINVLARLVLVAILPILGGISLSGCLYALGHIGPSFLFTFDTYIPGGALAAIWLPYILLVILIGTILLFRYFQSRHASPQDLVHDQSNDINTTEVSWKQRAVALLIYLGVALLLIRPVVGALATRQVGSGDGEYWMWQGWRLSELVKDGNLIPWRIPDVMFPYGNDLRLGDGLLPSAIGMAWNLVASPILAYNLSLITATVLNCWAAARMARELSSMWIVHILTAVAFATAPALTLRLNGHYNLYFAFVVPLIFAEVFRSVWRGCKIRSIRLGLLLFLAFLSSFYYLAFGLIAATIILLVSVFSDPESSFRSAKRTATGLCFAIGFCVILMAPIVLPHLRLEEAERSAGALSTPIHQARIYSADLSALWSQPSGSILQLPRFSDVVGGNVVEATIFPGLLLLAGVGLLILVKTRLRWPILAAFVTVWMLSLGPALRDHGQFLADRNGELLDWLPFQLFGEVPGMSGLRAPNRASFVLAAIGAAALALVLEGWVVRFSGVWRYVGLTAGATLLIFNLQSSVNSSGMGLSASSLNALETMRRAHLSGDTVAVIPADCFQSTTDVKTQIVHRLPMLGCQAFASAVPWYSGLEEYSKSVAYASIRCIPQEFGSRFVNIRATEAYPSVKNLLQLRSEFGVRYFIYDKRINCHDVPRSQAIRNVLRSNARLLAQDDVFEIYDAANLQPAR